ncbi:MAG: hypothetical protein ACRD82_00720, partial [Blastocatellia bacterium]
GTGSAAVKTDVGITGDRISFVGDATTAGIQANRVIGASGLIFVNGKLAMEGGKYTGALAGRALRKTAGGE